MSAPKVDIGLFLVEVQQAITAVGTYCDDLDKLTIASEPARDKLSELLVQSIVVSQVFRELVEAAQVAVTNPKGLNRLGVAVARARGVV